MRLRVCLLASVVALCATTLTVATAGATGAPDHRATEATATTLSHTPSLAETVRRPRPDAGLRLALGLGFLFAGFEGPAVFSPGVGQDRMHRLVLLDGSDRWRSLLLGAPPLLA